MVWWFAGGGATLATEPPQWPELTFTPQDRLLILAPHPDDEILGCGGVIQRAVAMDLPVRIVFLTSGDANEWSFLIYRKRPVLSPKSVRRMGAVRRDEAIAATKLLGLSPEQLTFFGYPDLGTLHIWNSHWGNRPAYRGLFTRATAVPYDQALRPGAPYKGEEILQDLTTVLREFKPTKIFVSHPGDHMPDHLALYLFLRVALWDLKDEAHPEVLPYLIHFRNWPTPLGYHPEIPIEPPEWFQADSHWQALTLSPEEIERKRAALRAHRTQYNSSARYLQSFLRSQELFGDFPSVPLHSSSPVAVLSSRHAQEVTEAPEELTDQERAAFVGFEERSVQLDGDQLVVSMRFSRPLAQAVEAEVSLFGYRSDRPFAQMPKLRAKFGALTHKLSDQHRRLSNNLLVVTRKPRQLVIRVPLQVLGQPQKILTSARTYLGEVPLDWVSWRVLELPASAPLTDPLARSAK